VNSSNLVQTGREGAERGTGQGALLPSGAECEEADCCSADHIDAVERGLGGDAEGILGEAEGIVGDADLEMLGHVAPSQHRADGLADRLGAAQRTARPLHAGRDAREVVFGAGQQLRAFADALFGQQRILANHQAFARIVGAGMGCDLRNLTVPCDLPMYGYWITRLGKYL
jgi:hypothetical protein